MIALIGLPGSGKTTVGRQLARRLKVPFLDSDRVIEERIGCSIKEYFAREGEEKFRDVEEAVIAELTLQTPSVVSTGGGAVLRDQNRWHLKSRGTVVYLKSMPEELARRLKRDTQRPLLQVGDPLAKLRDLFELRDPLYQATCNFVIETGRPSVSTLVNMIVMQLELSGLSPENMSSLQ